MKIPGRPPSVAKIFRLHLEHAGPYLRFRRESTSCSLLCRVGLLGTVVPTVHGVLRISPSHEAALEAEGKLDGLQTMRYRVRSATAPLMAVWMEFAPERRLPRDDVGLSLRAGRGHVRPRQDSRFRCSARGRQMEEHNGG